jgi:hypothetical protein
MEENMRNIAQAKADHNNLHKQRWSTPRLVEIPRDILPSKPDEAVAFLKQSRPMGPWTVRAIDPDDDNAPSELETFSAEGDLLDFLWIHCGAHKVIAFGPNGNGADREHKSADHEHLNGVAAAAALAGKPGVVPSECLEGASTLPPRTPPDKDGKPYFITAGDEGPQKRNNELRRHIYCRAGVPVRVKIKNRSGQAWVDWYRVRDGERIGWQAKKPEGYEPVPYFDYARRSPFDYDPVDFDPERDDQLPVYWPEGEGDVDTLAELGLAAFTYGGASGSRPPGCERHVADRHVVVFEDNDEAGRDHARKKAARCYGTAASVKIVKFPELPAGGDVSDWLLDHSADDLQRHVAATEYWSPPRKRARAATPSQETDGAPEEVTDEIARLVRRMVSPDAITLEPGLLPQVIRQSEAAILKDPKHQPVFQRGGHLVRLARDATIDDGIARPKGALTIAEVDAQWLRLRMMQASEFYKYDARAKKELPKDLPLDYAIALLSSAQWSFPVLTGTVEAPTMRPDGTILDIPGYDAKTGLHFDPGSMVFPPIPENPGEEDARKALGVLKDVLREFPFVVEENNPEVSPSRSVVLAAIMTSLVRRILRTAPLTIFDAPTRASGKTLLSDIVSYIAIGRTAPAMTWTGSEEENRKRLHAALITGELLVQIDNISAPLQGDALCAILTQEFYSDRWLGHSKLVTVPTCCNFMATGNNINVVGDLCTRSLSARLDPQMEHPEERTFERPNLRAYVLEHRAEIVCAALTMMRAYVVAGRPKPRDMKPYGRFEEWSNLVRSTLIWLGEPDPCASAKLIMAADPEVEGLADVLDTWKVLFGGAPKTSPEVIRTATEAAGQSLRDALEAVLVGKELKARTLTAWLRKIADRVVGDPGLRIRRIGNGKEHAGHWRFEEVKRPATH